MAAGALALAVLAAASAGVRATDDAALCAHTFDSAGVGFNLSPLQQDVDNNQLRDQKAQGTYVLQMCANLPSGTCKEGECASVLQSNTVEPSPLFDYGRYSEDTLAWELLDSANPTAGVVLTVSGGPQCTGSSRQVVNRFTRVEVTCDEDARNPTNKQVSTVECGVTWKFNSYAGCPSYYSSGLSGGWVFIILLLVASAVYCGGGAAYKKATLGTSGVESVPNVDFWRDFAEYVQAGCELSYRTATCSGRDGLRDGGREVLADESEDVGLYAAPGDGSML